MDRQFGIEIEFFGGRSAAEEALRTAGLNARDIGYSHNVVPFWKLVPDGSASGMCEAVSPILRGEPGLEEAGKAAKALSSDRRFRVSRSCGLHVHFDVRDLSLSQIKMILKKYAKFEDALDLLMAPSRAANNNAYCRSIVWQGWGTLSEDQRKAHLNHLFNRIDRCTSMRDLSRLDGLVGRYRKVNLESFWRYGTLEFRHHGGTLDATKIVNWIRLLDAIVNRSASQRSIKPSDKTGSAQQRLDLLLRTLKAPGALKRHYRRRARTLHPGAR